MVDRTVRRRRGRVPVGLVLAGLLAGPVALSPAPATALELPDKGQIAVLHDRWGDRHTDEVSQDGQGTYDPSLDPGSLHTVTRAIGARDVWAHVDAQGRAVTGRGVTVALLDSGLVPVPGLDGEDKVVQGPDLSLENEVDAVRGLDTFGHGTHLGGVVAALDAGVSRDPRTGTPRPAEDEQVGVAPDATLMSLKLATANGSTDVSQVIAALDWVTQHRADGGRDVRVVNLAFGTTSLQPYEIDPLAAAAENAWRHGLVVVVSGGNEGQDAGRLTDPAIDPYVLAVGASDPQQRVDGWRTPQVAAFSNGGSPERHVDLVAPGRSITSLRDPGSFVDTHHPEGRVDGDASGRLFRGSGTSQAAAVVSGAAALLLQADPALTPDQVKALLVGTARPIPGVSPLAQGAGQVDVAAAAAALRAARRSPVQAPLLAAAAQAFPAATGTGSLEAARAGSNLVDPHTGEVLAGEVDAQGLPFDSPTWAAASSAGTAWSGGRWNGAPWTGDHWEQAWWSDADPTSTRWSSARWSSARWSSARWSDASWDSARWSSARWSGVDWDSARWSSARWSGADWDSARWSSARWS